MRRAPCSPGCLPGGTLWTVTRKPELRQSMAVLLNQGGRDENSGFPRWLASAEQNPKDEAAAQKKVAQIKGSLTFWPNTKLCICRARLHKAVPKRITREERNASGAMIELTKYP